MRRHRTRPADDTARLPQNPANFDALARTQHEGTLGNNYLQIRTPTAGVFLDVSFFLLL